MSKSKIQTNDLIMFLLENGIHKGVICREVVGVNIKQIMINFDVSIATAKRALAKAKCRATKSSMWDAYHDPENPYRYLPHRDIVTHYEKLIQTSRQIDKSGFLKAIKSVK